MAGSKHGIAGGDARDAQDHRDYKARSVEDLLAPKIISATAPDDGAEK